METCPSRRRSVSAIAAAICVICSAAITLSGCSVAQLGAMQFRKDNRLTYTSPRARSLVTLPVLISWRFTAEDGNVPQQYGVFVDRSPMAVGKGLADLASGDDSCGGDSHCPDASYLASLGVYVTTDERLPLDVLPRVGGVGDEQHTVTVVPLDRAGIRRSESAWYVDFRLRRRF